jgi:hypothetical protein
LEGADRFDQVFRQRIAQNLIVVIAESDTDRLGNGCLPQLLALLSLEVL